MDSLHNDHYSEIPFISVYRTMNPAAVLLEPPHKQLHWSFTSAFSNWLLFNPSRLSPEYAGSTIPLITSFTDVRNIATLLTVIFYGTLGIFAVTRNKNDVRKRVAVCGLGLTILPYLPASNLFFPVGFVVAERVLYLPSMGFCMLVGYGVYTLIKSHRKLVSNSAKVLLLSILLLHTTKTVLQNRVWFSEKDLYLSALRAYPTNGKMWHNLGTQLGHGIHLNQSELLMRQCIATEPNYLVAYSDLGTILSKQNKKEEAEKVSIKNAEEWSLESGSPETRTHDTFCCLKLC